MVENCKVCAMYQQQRAEPLIPTPFPECPWQMIGTDICRLDNLNYLIVVDYFSRYIEVAAMKARHGIPEEVRSDNGPQYASAEFTHFAKEWGFRHTTSSPHFPQSNSEAKHAVETTKSLLKKEKDPAKGLLEYRSSPPACSYSPSELLMGRKLRNTIPTFHTVLNPSWPDMEKLRVNEAESKEKQRLNFNHRHNAAPLKALQPGIPVHIKDMGTTGTVTRAAETPRSYMIETEKGTVRRNRSHVNPIPNNKSVSPNVSDKSMSPSVTKQQPQDKALTPLKPLPSPCLSSRPK